MVVIEKIAPEKKWYVTNFEEFLNISFFIFRKVDAIVPETEDLEGWDTKVEYILGRLPETYAIIRDYHGKKNRDLKGCHILFYLDANAVGTCPRYVEQLYKIPAGL